MLPPEIKCTNKVKEKADYKIPINNFMDFSRMQGKIQLQRNEDMTLVYINQIIWTLNFEDQ